MIPSSTFHPGDIVLTRGSGPLPRAIRALTRQRGETATKVNHVGIVVAGGYPLASAVLVEALLRVKCHRVQDGYGGGGSQLAVFRPVTLTAGELLSIAAAARGFIGRNYGSLKLLLHLADWCLGGRYVFRRIGKMDEFPICSYLVARAYATAGKDFGVPDRAASPDDIWDFCVRSRHYKCVRELGPFPGPQGQ